MNAAACQKIGFVGLGDQGAPMAKAIAEAGFELHVWARRSQSFAALSDVQFTRHDTLSTLAGSAGIFGLCLRDDHDIWDLLREQGLGAALRSGSVVVNHGTGDPEENRKIGSWLENHGVGFLDAPVSGGRPGAIARTLTTFVGGGSEPFARCQPIFESFSRKVARMGPVGSGQMTKLLNNALTMTNLKNSVDVFGMARELGISARALYEVIVVSSGSSAILQAVGRDLGPEAAAHVQALMRKDIEHFAEAMDMRGLDPAAVRDRGLAGAEGVVDLARWIRD